jgi:hypothetical protein
MIMFILIAIGTVLTSGQQIMFNVRTPFKTEDLCQQRAPNFMGFVASYELPTHGLIPEDVKIETKCVLL